MNFEKDISSLNIRIPFSISCFLFWQFNFFLVVRGYKGFLLIKLPYFIVCFFINKTTANQFLSISFFSSIAIQKWFSFIYSKILLVDMTFESCLFSYNINFRFRNEQEDSYLLIQTDKSHIHVSLKEQFISYSIKRIKKSFLYITGINKSFVMNFIDRVQRLQHKNAYKLNDIYKKNQKLMLKEIHKKK